MEVILSQDVDRLGKAGQVVKVKDGYARNFLIPNRLAVPMTSANLKKIEQETQQKMQRLDRAKKAAETLRDKLAGLSLTIAAMAQEQDKIYGSIGAGEIAAALKEEGFIVDKNTIRLEEPIKALGIYEIPLTLHPEISVTIKVWVVKK